MEAVFTRATDISTQIEKVRRKMEDLGRLHGLLHPDVQNCSEELDKLLLEFYAIHYSVPSQSSFEMSSGGG